MKEISLVLSLVEKTFKRDVAAMQMNGVVIREGNVMSRHWVL